MTTDEGALDWALAFIDRLEKPSAPLHIWHPMKQLEDGSYSAPWCELSADAMELVQGLYERGLILTFDWPAWSETAESYVDNPELLAEASLDDCLKLLTCHVRSDRFCEGHLGAMLENGHIVAVLRRMREIRKS